MTQPTQTNPADETAHDPIDADAALWVARLSSPDAIEADRRACEAWKAADPRHAHAYAGLEAWRRTMVRAPVRAPDPRATRKPPKGLAVIALCALAAAMAYRIGLIDRLRADAWTDIGQITTTALADGSRVDLNTDTALALHFTPEERGVTILRGEAAFDVATDPERPFVVRGDGLSVRAIGTRFYVRTGRASDPVGVAEGRVEVVTEGGRARLLAGEILARNADGRPIGHAGDVARMMAWRDGALVASGQPLASVLAELERYRRGTILLLASGLADRRFSGTLDLRDTDSALDVLAAAMGFRVVRLSPFLVLIRPAS